MNVDFGVGLGGIVGEGEKIPIAVGYCALIYDIGGHSIGKRLDSSDIAQPFEGVVNFDEGVYTNCQIPHALIGLRGESHT